MNRQAPIFKTKTLVSLDRQLKKQVKLHCIEHDMTFCGWVNRALQRQLATETATDPQPQPREAVAMGR